MWKLIKYDFIVGRNYFITSFAILLFYTTVVLSNRLKGDNFIPIVIFMMIMFVNMFSFFLLFSKIYTSRLRKDDLVFYAGIKKRYITLEPIIYILLYSVANSITLCIPLLFANDINEFALIASTNTLLQASDNIYYVIFVFIATFNSLMFVYGGVSLCLWSILKKKKEVMDTTSDMIGFNMFILLISSKVISAFISTTEYVMLCLFTISFVCMIVYYVRSIRSF